MHSPGKKKGRWEEKEFCTSRNQERPGSGHGQIGVTQKWGLEFAAALVSRLSGETVWTKWVCVLFRHLTHSA